jgi:hypothetical protein
MLNSPSFRDPAVRYIEGRMPRISPDGKNANDYKLLRKKLEKAGDIRNVSSRIFQRIPFVVQEIDHQLSKRSTKLRKKGVHVDLILKNVKDLVEGRKEDTKAMNMPVKLSSYVDYMDLLVRIVEADSSKDDWVVYLLTDFPGDIRVAEEIEIEGYNLRKRMKTALKARSMSSSVQAETRDDRIWLRVAMIKRTKNKLNDLVKLETAPVSLVVYFPGEPYFYSAPGLEAELGEALCACLGCDGWEQHNLSGRLVDNLRMQLGRDVRGGAVTAKPNGNSLSKPGPASVSKSATEHPARSSRKPGPASVSKSSIEHPPGSSRKPGPASISKPTTEHSSRSSRKPGPASVSKPTTEHSPRSSRKPGPASVSKPAAEHPNRSSRKPGSFSLSKSATEHPPRSSRKPGPASVSKPANKHPLGSSCKLGLASVSKPATEHSPRSSLKLLPASLSQPATECPPSSYRKPGPASVSRPSAKRRLVFPPKPVPASVSRPATECRDLNMEAKVLESVGLIKKSGNIRNKVKKLKTS